MRTSSNTVIVTMGVVKTRILHCTAEKIVGMKAMVAHLSPTIIAVRIMKSHTIMKWMNILIVP